jgi:hypothetical protein
MNNFLHCRYNKTRVPVYQHQDLNNHMEEKNIIIYKTQDGKTSVSLLTKDGTVWMNQTQLAELFDTSKQNIGQHVSSILEDKELDENSVVKNYFTTAADGKVINSNN